jgi:hypothetical protein
MLRQGILASQAMSGSMWLQKNTDKKELCRWTRQSDAFGIFRSLAYISPAPPPRGVPRFHMGLSRRDICICHREWWHLRTVHEHVVFKVHCKILKRQKWTDRQIEVYYLILTITFLLCSNFMWIPVQAQIKPRRSADNICAEPSWIANTVMGGIYKK